LESKQRFARIDDLQGLDNTKPILLSPFRGAFLHQGLQRFVFRLLPTVFAFVMICYSIGPSPHTQRKMLSFNCTLVSIKNRVQRVS